MIRFFAAHPTAANLLMLLLMVIGLVSLPSLNRETFPDFTRPEVEVRVPYPGASPEDVEEAVCQRIEDAVDSVNDVYETRCEALEGVGVAVVRMREAGDMQRFLDDVKTEVEAIDSFPDETETMVIRQLGRTDHVVSLALTGPMSDTDLKAYAEQFKDRLQRLPKVSLVEVEGFSEHQLRVHVPQYVLRRHGLSINDIADAITRQSIDLPAGTVLARDRELLVRFADERSNPRELAELIVVGAQGRAGEVRLGDIAEISDRFELDEDKILFNARRAAVLKVTKTKAEDTLEVMDEVTAFLDRERPRLPPGVSLTITQDQSSLIRDRLRMMLKNGWQGLLLVFLVMWLFFRPRFAFWVAMGLPVSFLGGLFLMTLLGLSINMITMVGLLIGIGLLMDDAIVIAENIATHLQQGKSALNAAVDGLKQVMPGVTASFLTTVAVFGPLAFLAGDMGKVLKFIPMVLLLVLSVSLLEAFLILPHHLAHAFEHGAKRPAGRWRQRFEAMVERFRDRVVGRAVDWVVDHRYLFAGLVVALFVVSIAMVVGRVLKFQPFPDIDGDTLEARVLLPQGTPLARTEAVIGQLRAALQRVDDEFSPRQPDGQRLVRNVSTQYNKNLDAHENGAHVATLSVDLLTAEVRDASVDDIVNRWREEVGEVADVLNLSFKEPRFGPAGIPIELRLQGDDLDELKAASREMQDWLSRYRGVFDISDDLRPGKPELRLRLREGALALGLDASAIASQLRGAFYGSTAADIQVGRESYEIDVRLGDADRDSLDDLAYFRVTTPAGDQVPLGSVAILEQGRGHARIQRIDGRRTVTVIGDADTRATNVAEVIADTEKRFMPQLSQRYPGVKFVLQGQASETEKTGSSLRRGFLLGLVGIFVLLSFQFRSYREPIVVMVVIPLGLIGVIWGHLLMGLELSMPSVVGFASLAGIVVNDSILLVEFLKLRVRAGHAIPEAAKLASRARFRAVLLTSLTTIAGLLPLLSERSLQAQVLIPLATSLVFGLLTATVLVLFVVPAVFSILDDWGWTSLNEEKYSSATPITQAVD